MDVAANRYIAAFTSPSVFLVTCARWDGQGDWGRQSINRVRLATPPGGLALLTLRMMPKVPVPMTSPTSYRSSILCMLPWPLYEAFSLSPPWPVEDEAALEAVEAVCWWWCWYWGGWTWTCACA